jgi:hypothetical protein
MSHVSPTQLGMYFRCGEQFRRRYIEGERIPPSVAMVSGSAVHKGAEINYRAKKEHGADLPTEQVVEAAVAAFDAGAADGVRLGPDEEGAGKERALGTAKDATARMSRLHRVHLAPTVQPDLIEQRIEITVPGLTRTVLGIVDLATTERVIVDLKTGSKAKAKALAHRSLQLTVYDVAYEALTGQRAAGLAIHEVTSTAKPTVQSIPTTRDDNDRAVLANYLGAFERGVAAGYFPPADPGAWHCSRRWCGYATTCRFFPSHRGDIGE